MSERDAGDEPVAARSPGPAAVYERELEVSLDRIWENVLDWEHLPHLHSQAFSSVHLLASDREGWRAEVGLAGSTDGADIDVRLDRAHRRYSTRTLGGAGAGTGIVTELFERAPGRTGIRVEFHLPWAPAHAAGAIGEYYRTLYDQLWDQDDAMMRERQRVIDSAGARSGIATGESVSIGRMRELAGRLPLEVTLGGRRFRVASIDGRLVAHDTRCPHLGGPLAERPLEGCEAVCPWHGYRFDVRSGRSSDGRSLRLAPAAVVEIDACEGEVRLRLP